MDPDNVVGLETPSALPKKKHRIDPAHQVPAYCLEMISMTVVGGVGGRACEETKIIS